MFHDLWSKAVQDPPLAAAFLLILLAASTFLSVFVQVVLEGWRSKPTTLQELQKDAATAERQDRIRAMQKTRMRVIHQPALSAHGDLRDDA